jgi:hypothetical protein
LITNLEHTVDEPHGSLSRLNRLLEPFSPERVRTLSCQFPLSAFRLTQLQVTLANHQGLTDESEFWAALSEELAPNVAVYENSLSSQSDRLNRELVNERHNRYIFRPELPDNVCECLESLKTFQKLGKGFYSETVASPLGRFYGTIAQNYGFCGSAYLDKVETYVGLAQEAFGGGQVPEYEQDWRRQFNYLFYAYLDAETHEKARQALENYLGEKIEDLTMDRLDKLHGYEHAALVRYFAETQVCEAFYLDWSLTHWMDRPMQHPWQLWLTNLGHLLEEEWLKREVWERALQLCLKLGPTVQAMALLPLADLWEHKLVPWDRLERKTTDVLNRLRASSLNVDHFHPLLESRSWAEALHRTLARRKDIFPFSYR